MKIIISIMIMNLLVSATAPTALAIQEAAYDAAEEDAAGYMEVMITAAASGDTGTGEAAQEARDQIIDQHELQHEKISFEDLYLTAKIIQNEAGSDWITDEHQRLVGSVVLNRVDSPEFPDTVHDVVYQKGQYSGTGSGWFSSLTPSERAVRNAAYILEYGSIAPASVVFQSNYQQGSGVYKAISAGSLGYTYFCYSSHANLYA